VGGTAKPRVRRVAEQIFDPDDVADALALLERDCCPGEVAALTERGTERVRLAALKLSGGNLQRLVKAICLAQMDWRDALLGAGFGHDTGAHVAWAEACIGSGSSSDE
jgi:hypothetical protein